MSVFTSFLESYVIAHVLLAVGSLFAGRFLLRSVSKLALARILFAACIFSPLAVQWVKPANKPLLARFISIDGIRKSTNTSAIQPAKSAVSQQVINTPDFYFNAVDYKLLATLFVAMMIAFRGFRVSRDLLKVRTVLRHSQILRARGQLSILVSDRCFVPFSIRSLSQSYIVLPVSMLTSTTDIRIAIAHEGQHHRQGDCLFAYGLECVSILFFGNPGIARWKNVFTELQEFSCDEALVGRQFVTPHDYGRCLLKVAQIASQGPGSSWREFACAVGMAQICGNTEASILKRRIAMLSKYQSPRPARMFFQTTLAGLFVVVPLCSAYAARGTLAETHPESLDTSSLDSRIQKIAEQEIDGAVSRYKAKSGAIVIADPKSGRILAFAERRLDSKSESWSSRVFTPASTLKPFIAAAAIESGVATEFQKYDCRGPYEVAGTKFHNYDKSFAEMSLTEGIAKSANVCIIKAALDTGSDRVRKVLGRFGFDTNSQWRTDTSDALQLAEMSLGENIPVTFSTMVKTYSILANKGHLPNLESAVSEATAESVQRTLVAAVEQGIAKRSAIPGVLVAGKTGTMADHSNGRFEETQAGKHFGLFAGYAPANNPRFVSFVIIEDGYRSDGDHEKAGGGVLAAPVFREVMRKSLEIVE